MQKCHSYHWLSALKSRAIAALEEEMSALILLHEGSVSAELKNFIFHIHFQKESDRGNSLGDLSLNTVFLCVGKGESKRSHEYEIFGNETIWRENIGPGD